jgi:hypothetical protein
MRIPNTTAVHDRTHCLQRPRVEEWRRPRWQAARFFQIENQSNAALDLRIAASLPLIKFTHEPDC